MKTPEEFLAENGFVPADKATREQAIVTALRIYEAETAAEASFTFANAARLMFRKPM